MPKSVELKVPNDLQQCQKMIVNMHEQLQNMQAQIDALLRSKYGTKSEAIPAGQLRLFGDQVQESNEKEEEPAKPEPGARSSSHGRKKLGRELPRVRKIYDVAEEAVPCPSCNAAREVIGEETSEQYDYTPASIRVIEHVRLKRACKTCAEHVVIAPKPASVIERGLATAEMLGYVATSKFADHLPLNRLEGIFKRDGAVIARSTMCDWMASMASQLLPLYEKMKICVKSSRVIWTDDTPIKMQDRSHEKNMRNARAWVYLGDAANPYIVFDFTESRKRDSPLEFLGDFKGFLQADAFSGYDCIFAAGTVHEVACWAHARRKFFEALQSSSTACGEALAMIQQLYAVEKDGQSLTDADRLALHQARSIGTLKEFKAWLDNQKLIALPKSALGKAVTYAINNWNALCTYTTDGALTIDNNKSERALRSMAVGRKNWLFVGSPAGGKTAAILSSFIATCKSHDLHPRTYFADVLTRLANGETDLDSLLPGNWKPLQSS